MSPQRFSIVPGIWSIVRLGADEVVPAWALNAASARAALLSITRTSDELSIVCATALVPPGYRAEGGWGAIKLHGPFSFAEVGVISSFAAPLATVAVSIFAISTFDTDHLLIKTDKLKAACDALVAAGHHLVEGVGGSR